MKRLAVLAMMAVCSACVTVEEQPARLSSEQVSDMPATPVQAPDVIHRHVAQTQVGQRNVARIQVMVREDGRAGDRLLIRSTGNDTQDNAALASLDHWRFAPAQDEDGNAVPMQMVVPVTVN